MDHKQFRKIATFVSNKKILFTIHDLVMSIAEPLISLGVCNFQELIDPTDNLYLIPWEIKDRFLITGENNISMH